MSPLVGCVTAARSSVSAYGMTKSATPVPKPRCPPLPSSTKPSGAGIPVERQRVAQAPLSRPSCAPRRCRYRCACRGSSRASTAEPLEILDGRPPGRLGEKLRLRARERSEVDRRAHPRFHERVEFVGDAGVGFLAPERRQPLHDRLRAGPPGSHHRPPAVAVTLFTGESMSYGPLREPSATLPAEREQLAADAATGRAVAHGRAERAARPPSRSHASDANRSVISCPVRYARSSVASIVRQKSSCPTSCTRSPSRTASRSGRSSLASGRQSRSSRRESIPHRRRSSDTGGRSPSTSGPSGEPPPSGSASIRTTKTGLQVTPPSPPPSSHRVPSRSATASTVPPPSQT